MSQTQQKAAVPLSRSVEVAPTPTVSSDTAPLVPEATWEPFLGLITSWQRADAACSKATERAGATRKAGEDRALSVFEAEKSKLDSAHKERMEMIQDEKKSAQAKADNHLNQVKKTETGVRRALGTVGLDTLMDDIQVPIITEPSNEQDTQLLLLNSIARSTEIDEALQDDLFAIRAARQRQSAQMWAVGIGLWLVSAIAFAPYAPITALLVGIAVFVMATPRKIAASDALRPSFAAHIGHCIALLFGKQQVMQYPFSLVEKGREVSGIALGGALAAGLIAWMIFESEAPIVHYEPRALGWHLGLMGVLSGLAGIITFAVANQHVTLAELSEATNNKILR